MDTGVITSYALYILVGLIFNIIVYFSYDTEQITDNQEILLIIIFGLLSIMKVKIKNVLYYI